MKLDYSSVNLVSMTEDYAIIHVDGQRSVGCVSTTPSSTVSCQNIMKAVYLVRHNWDSKGDPCPAGSTDPLPLIEASADKSYQISSILFDCPYNVPSGQSLKILYDGQPLLTQTVHGSDKILFPHCPIIVEINL